MGRDDLITSPLLRFLKLGGLMGRVGASLLGARALDFARSDASKQIRQTESLIKNATRIVETLGEMKGAAMKVGQMLSLHEGLLPPEVAAILGALQQEAPNVPFEVMQYEVRGALENFDELFESLEPEAHAAASIGQVHRGKLKDGRQVAVKIQYPLIDRIIEADMKNLRTLLQGLFSLVSTTDFDPVWKEVRDRLREEVDYEREAANLSRMAALHADVPEIVIPRVVDEASASNVLTMEFISGIPPGEACSDRYDAKLRSRWGVALFRFVFRGLLRHRFLHADPNLANFAFLDDGRIIVYDFGCVKRIPDAIAQGYVALMRAAVDDRPADIPRILHDMGVYKGDGDPLPREMTDPYVEIFRELVRADPPYTFGEDQDLYQKLVDLGMDNLSAAMDIHFPEDLVFVNRSLSGHYGNLSRLRATAPWRDLTLEFANSRHTRQDPTERDGS